jgi:hypothetical protein
MERLSPGQLWVVWVVALVRMVELVLVLPSVAVVLLASVVKLQVSSSVVQVWVVLVVPLHPWQVWEAWVEVLVLVAGLDQVLESVRVALQAVSAKRVVESHSASQLFGTNAPSLCSSCPAAFV